MMVHKLAHNEDKAQGNATQGKARRGTPTSCPISMLRVCGIRLKSNKNFGFLVFWCFGLSGAFACFVSLQGKRRREGRRRSDRSVVTAFDQRKRSSAHFLHKGASTCSYGDAAGGGVGGGAGVGGVTLIEFSV